MYKKILVRYNNLKKRVRDKLENEASSEKRVENIQVERLNGRYRNLLATQRI